MATFVWCPASLMVPSIAAGALLWNIYISVIARQESRAEAGWQDLSDSPEVSARQTGLPARIHPQALGSDLPRAGGVNGPVQGGVDGYTRITTCISSSAMSTRFTTLPPTPPSPLPPQADGVHINAMSPQRRGGGNGLIWGRHARSRDSLEGRISSPLPKSWHPVCLCLSRFLCEAPARMCVCVCVCVCGSRAPVLAGVVQAPLCATQTHRRCLHAGEGRHREDAGGGSRHACVAVDVLEYRAILGVDP